MIIKWKAAWAAVLGLGGMTAPLHGQGFPNVTQTPGSLLTPLLAPQQGRTAVIAYHNGWLYTVPEMPASQPGSDFLVRRWNISNLSNVRVAETYDETEHPVMAHGYLNIGDYLVLGDNWPGEKPFSFRAISPGVNQRTTTPGLQGPYDRGDLFQPWHINTYWTYNTGEINDPAVLSKNGTVLATWDHIGQTGVIGHPFIFGNLLIYASEQSRTGVAIYDISNPAQPRLLDVLKTGGPGGYWPELWGGDGKLYLVFPYQEPTSGMRVVDITDPENMRFVADVSLPGAQAMYVQFQDDHAFLGSHKVDMRTFQSVLRLDTEGQNIDTSQFLLPIGNLLATGGVGENQGLAIWAHQAAPDTRGPAAGYHLPRAGQTNYPAGASISLLIHETLDTRSITVGTNLIVRPVGGTPLTGKAVFSFDDILTFTPTQNLLANTTYEVILPAGGIKDVAGNGIEEYAFTFSTGSTVSGNRPPQITGFSSSRHPVPVGGSVTLSASANDPENDALEFRFDFGDGSDRTAWATARAVTHTYANGGHFNAKVHVRDPSGLSSTSVLTVTVTNETANRTPARSTAVIADETRRTIWTVNPDSNTISAHHADTLTKRFEVPVARDPRSVAIDSQGRAWVACRGGDRLDLIGPDGIAGTPVTLDYGDAPSGLVISPNGLTAYVSLYGAGEVIRLSTTTGAITGRLTVGPTPHALALSPDGGTLYVSRFISLQNHAEIWRINSSSFTLSATHRLEKLGGEMHRDGTAEGKGTPNYLAGLAVSRDGTRLLVASNKMNSEKGLLTGSDLDQDNSVRNLVSILDTTTGSVLDSLDIDNSDSATAIAFSPLGDYFVVTLQGNNEIALFDYYAVSRSAGLGGLMTRQRVGSAPRGLTFDTTSGKLFVQNYLSRDLSVFALSEYLSTGKSDFLRTTLSTVANETLAPAVLRGKQIFYHASDPRMSAEGYLSCATCHSDAGFDGRTWDFTGRGEGLRNTTSLNGRGGLGMGNLHWSANFDEVQDFEHDIRGAFGGSGFLTNAQFESTSTPGGAPKAGLNPDLDALAAYLGSLGHDHLPKSPHRSGTGILTSSAAAGAALLVREGCATCHSGNAMTDARLHEVGTLSSTSGKRLHLPLPGIETPTLRGLWESAPYLHDGSAKTLDEVFAVTGGVSIPAERATATGGTEIITEWTYYNNDETVRGEALAQIASGGRLTFSGVNGGAGGVGAIAIRYSSGYQSGTLRVRVNGVNHSVTVTPTGNQPDWRYVNWQVVRVPGVTLNAGAGNTIELSVLSPDWLPVGIDEITVSTPDRLAAAQPHLRVARMSAGERTQLLDYLLQLDGSPLEGVAPSAPDSPTGLSLSPAAGDSVQLGWTLSPDTLRYRIYRGNTPDFAGAGVIGTSSVASFRDLSPPVGTSLFYWVNAVNDEGESAPGSFIAYNAPNHTGPDPEVPRPDLSLGEDLSSLTGDGIFEGRQIFSQTLARGGSADTWLRLENDAAPGAIRLTASPASRDYNVRFFQIGDSRKNVTAQITSDRLDLNPLPIPENETIQIRSRHIGRKSRLALTATARSLSDETRRDSVRLMLRVR
jgi:DNA-binding beta-propeller fold protein YncE